MTLERLNALYMIRKYEGGGECAVFRRKLDDKEIEAKTFRSLRAEDVPVFFPNVKLEAAAPPEEPAVGGGGVNGVEEEPAAGAGEPAAADVRLDKDWKSQAVRRVQTFGKADRLLAYATDTLHLTIEGNAAALPLPELKGLILETIKKM